jgi:hypothetical protein
MWQRLQRRVIRKREMATNDQRRTVVGILNALGEANDEVGYHGIRFLWHMFKTKNLRWSDLTSKKVDKVVRERIERVLAHIRDDNLPEARVAVGRVLNMLGTAGLTLGELFADSDIEPVPETPHSGPPVRPGRSVFVAGACSKNPGKDKSFQIVAHLDGNTLSFEGNMLPTPAGAQQVMQDAPGPSVQQGIIIAHDAWQCPLCSARGYWLCTRCNVIHCKGTTDGTFFGTCEKCVWKPADFVKSDPKTMKVQVTNAATRVEGAVPGKIPQIETSGRSG